MAERSEIKSFWGAFFQKGAALPLVARSAGKKLGKQRSVFPGRRSASAVNSRQWQLAPLVLIKRSAHVRGGESFPKITHNPQDTRHCWVSFLLPPAGGVWYDKTKRGRGASVKEIIRAGPKKGAQNQPRPPRSFQGTSEKEEKFKQNQVQ